jgi:hypothetical protein
MRAVACGLLAGQTEGAGRRGVDRREGQHVELTKRIGTAAPSMQKRPEKELFRMTVTAVIRVALLIEPRPTQV